MIIKRRLLFFDWVGYIKQSFGPFFISFIQQSSFNSAKENFFSSSPCPRHKLTISHFLSRNIPAWREHHSPCLPHSVINYQVSLHHHWPTLLSERVFIRGKRVHRRLRDPNHRRKCRRNRIIKVEILIRPIYRHNEAFQGVQWTVLLRLQGKLDFLRSFEMQCKLSSLTLMAI